MNKISETKAKILKDFETTVIGQKSWIEFTLADSLSPSSYLKVKTLFSQALDIIQKETVKEIKYELNRRIEYDENTNTIYFDKKINFEIKEEINNYDTFIDFLDQLLEPEETK